MSTISDRVPSSKPQSPADGQPRAEPSTGTSDALVGMLKRQRRRRGARFHVEDAHPIVEERQFGIGLPCARPHGEHRGQVVDERTGIGAVHEARSGHQQVPFESCPRPRVVAGADLPHPAARGLRAAHSPRAETRRRTPTPELLSPRAFRSGRIRLPVSLHLTLRIISVASRTSSPFHACGTEPRRARSRWTVATNTCNTTTRSGSAGSR